MEALIIDVENELGFISREINTLKGKKAKVQTETDPDNLDSHMKAIALTLHSVYTGYEKILGLYSGDIISIFSSGHFRRSPVTVCQAAIRFEKLILKEKERTKMIENNKENLIIPRTRGNPPFYLKTV